MSIEAFVLKNQQNEMFRCKPKYPDQWNMHQIWNLKCENRIFISIYSEKKSRIASSWVSVFAHSAHCCVVFRADWPPKHNQNKEEERNCECIYRTAQYSQNSLRWSRMHLWYEKNQNDLWSSSTCRDCVSHLRVNWNSSGERDVSECVPFGHWASHAETGDEDAFSSSERQVNGWDVFG